MQSASRLITGGNRAHVSKPLRPPLRQSPAVKVQHSIQQSPGLLEAVDHIVCTMAPKRASAKDVVIGDDMATSSFPGNHSV